MVTKLKDNLTYIMYIRKKMKEKMPEWEEKGVAYEGQINNNFQLDFKYLDNNVSFVKDRGLLELRIYYQNELVLLGYLLYNFILKKIPDQDPRWRLSLCTELIDYYIDFLKCYYERDEFGKLE